MKKEKLKVYSKNFRIVVVDNEPSFIEAISNFLKHFGYDFTIITNPAEAVKRIKSEHFDIMILNFMIDIMHDYKVVEKIRKFNKEIYIILLLDHINLMPSFDTIKKLDIQAYCEKSTRFNELLFSIESGIKFIKHINRIKDINNKLKDKSHELEQSYLDTISILRYTVEAKDPYTRGHSDRVSEYALLIGKKLGLDDKTLHTLKVGGLFHDIGKIGIPDSILLKESKLNEDEYSQIKKHPIIGSHILGDSAIFKDIIPIVKYHHERYDGNGYPEKLAGDNIPLVARILAVPDTFDAMTSNRSYRYALPLDDAISELKHCSGTQFDPSIVNQFLDILNNNSDTIQKIQNKYMNDI